MMTVFVFLNLQKNGGPGQKSGPQGSGQSILSLSHKNWEDYVDLFELTESAINLESQN